MKGFIYTLVSALALTGCLFAVAGFAQNPASLNSAAVGNDLPAFLHYHPTDGASTGGKVRAAMRLDHVQPR
ncbi:hypothetical protein [Asticcacaulis sp. EMRT-3]|uniref:hypothetical protein n=1 Tax=Asticcacaulis sp. EMRT-3 TaxID=3040349 RepID=UPI0024AF2370|nr:hypothetical protein [Asticcacaulis sp. EMRT-3]MDI7775320.1 hypothetical protein [Asticcacaulis sp. EMRT-3]